MNIFINSTKGKEEAISGSVTLGDFVYISGQYGKGNTIIQQTEYACSQIQKHLQCIHLKMHHIVKTTIYLTNFDFKEDVLNTYKKFFEAPYPASSVVEVNGLGKDVQICIEAMAIDTTKYERIQSQSCGDGVDC